MGTAVVPEKLAATSVVGEQKVQHSQHLSKADVTELKTFGKPPAEVMQAVVAVSCLVTGEECHNGWEQCKALLADPSFLSKLLSCDIAKVSPGALAQAKALADEPFFNVDAMKAKSCAAAGLVAWTLDM